MGMSADRTGELSPGPDHGQRGPKVQKQGEEKVSEPAGRKVTKLLSAKLPHDDTGAALMRFDDIRGQRYTEIFLIGGHAIIHDITAGIYTTTGRTAPGETGDTPLKRCLSRSMWTRSPGSTTFS